MSHELEEREDGTFSYVGARNPAWHLLGKTYEDQDGLTVAQVLTDLDAGEIISVPVTTQIVLPGATEPITISDPTRKLQVRVRTSGANIIGDTGVDYRVIPEAEAFGFIDKVIDSGEALVTSAGITHGGRRSFCCFRLPEQVMVGGVDAHDLYAMISISHDGSTPMRGAVTPVRVVCQNTVVMGLQQASHIWTVRHTSNADQKLQINEARRALDITYGYADAWNRAAEELLAKKVTDDMFDKLIEGMFGPNEPSPSKIAVSNWVKKRDELMTLFKVADTQANSRNTAWGAFNALVEYQDWFRPVRGVNEDEDSQAAAKFGRTMDEAFSTNKDNFKFVALGNVRTLVGIK